MNITSRGFTIFWAILMLWNGYDAYIEANAGNMGRSVFCFLFFAWCAFRFSQCITASPDTQGKNDGD